MFRVWHWLVFMIGAAVLLRIGALYIADRQNNGLHPAFEVTSTVKSPDQNLAAVAIERLRRGWFFETCEGEVRIVSASALGSDLNEAGREFIRTECGIFDGAAKIARLEWISPTRLRIAISTKAN